MLERDRSRRSRVRGCEMVGTESRQFARGVRGVVSARLGLPRSPSLRLRDASSVSIPDRFSVVLIVAALLLCHGAFGYAHQVPPVDVQAEHTVHSTHGVHSAPAGHAAGVHEPAGGGDAGGTHLADAYFATLLLILFGAALLVGGWVPVDVRLHAPRLRVGRGVLGLRPPRGPTIPRLQVFRL